MKYITAPIVAVSILLIAVAVCHIDVSCVRGPYNRIQNEVGDSLEYEYCVDNYRADIRRLEQNRVECVSAIRKIEVEMRVADKKRCLADSRVAALKRCLLAVGTSDMDEFKRLKSAYDATTAQSSAYATAVSSMSNSLAKLRQSLDAINGNCASAKSKLMSLASKKEAADILKSVNDLVENVNFVGDAGVAKSVEVVDDRLLNESVRLESFGSERKDLTEAEAAEFLDSIR